MEIQVDKTFLQNLVDEESDRVAFSTNKGKSDDISTDANFRTACGVDNCYSEYSNVFV